MTWCTTPWPTCPAPWRAPSTPPWTNATLPYALALADKGWKQAVAKDPGLARGVNVVDGEVDLRRGGGEAHGLPYLPLEEAL